MKLQVLDQNAPSFAGEGVEILNSALPQASTCSPADAAVSAVFGREWWQDGHTGL